MTTIACDRKELAGDLQFTEQGSGFKFKGKTKIYKFAAHPTTFDDCDFMVGFAGTASNIITVAEFFTLPETFPRPPKVKGLSGLVFTKKGDLFIFDDYDKWLIVNERYAAIGSGGAIALGAMSAGKSPTEAVKIAGKHDAYTGFGIRTLSWE